jgi:hypothetical protein
MKSAWVLQIPRPMYADRAKVIQIIKDLTQGDSPPRGGGALDSALEKSGVSREAYKAALNADPELADLENKAHKQAAVEAPDPGPYDTISRESPSGQPGDLTKSRET